MEEGAARPVRAHASQPAALQPVPEETPSEADAASSQHAPDQGSPPAQQAYNGPMWAAMGVARAFGLVSSAGDAVESPAEAPAVLHADEGREFARCLEELKVDTPEYEAMTTAQKIAYRRSLLTNITVLEASADGEIHSIIVAHGNTECVYRHPGTPTYRIDTPPDTEIPPVPTVSSQSDLWSHEMRDFVAH